MDQSYNRYLCKKHRRGTGFFPYIIFKIRIILIYNNLYVFISSNLNPWKALKSHYFLIHTI